MLILGVFQVFFCCHEGFLIGGDVQGNKEQTCCVGFELMKRCVREVVASFGKKKEIIGNSLARSLASVEGPTQINRRYQAF